MGEFLKFGLILLIVCGLAAGSLSFINQITKEPIAAFKKIEKEESMKQVFAAATSFREKITDRLWEAYMDEKQIGNVILTSIQGYGGPIVIMFSLDMENTVKGVKILSHTETPGLGAKIANAGFLHQFENKSIEQLKLKKDDPQNGAIDAVTAATISSRAVIRALNKDIAAFLSGSLDTGENKGAEK